MKVKKEVKEEFIKNNPGSYFHLRRLTTVGIIGVIYSVGMLVCNYFFHFSKWDYYLDASVLIISIFFLILKHVTLNKLARNYQLKKYKNSKTKK